MIEFVCTFPPVRITLLVAMVTMHFHIAQMSLVLGNIFFSFRGPREQFGTNEKLFLGCKVGQIRSCGIGYPISVLI